MVLEQCAATWTVAMSVAAPLASRAIRASAAAIMTSVHAPLVVEALTARTFPAPIVAFVHLVSKATLMCNALVSTLTDAPVGVTNANLTSFSVV